MSRPDRRSMLPTAVLVSLYLVAGCAVKEKIEPLAPHFAVTIPVGSGAQKPIDSDPLSRSDQSGALYTDDLLESRSFGSAGAPSNGVQRLSKAVQENVTAPGEVILGNPSGSEPAAMPATTQSSTGPATRGVPEGQFLVLGGVVGEVNDVPIYANKVLSLVEPILAARAKELNSEQFRAVATKEIALQMLALRNLELEYAAAERNLDEKDKKLADMLTEQWRTRQISAAGGSIELARRRAAERGEDFDELVQQQYRVMMSRVYYEKKVVPHIQVSAREIRDYYDRHRDTEFTQRGTARFRLIKIDFRKSGGREAALDKITGLRNRIVKAGQPFEQIARTVNDDPRWLKSGGDLGSAIEKGAFAIEPIEQAVWATPQGEVTDVIEHNGAFYIALVEATTQGSVQPFDSEPVQTRIVETLRAREFRALRQAEQERLVKEAVIRSDKEMMNTAIEMAMQNYSRWSR